MISYSCIFVLSVSTMLRSILNFAMHMISLEKGYIALKFYHISVSQYHMSRKVRVLHELVRLLTQHILHIPSYVMHCKKTLISSSLIYIQLTYSSLICSILLTNQSSASCLFFQYRLWLPFCLLHRIWLHYLRFRSLCWFWAISFPVINFWT